MFIKQYPNALSSDFCEHLIEKFEKDPAKYPGRIAGGYDPSIKSSTDLNLSENFAYVEEDQVLFRSLSESLSEYTQNCLKLCHTMLLNVSDSGYHIQRTTLGEGYTWHNDSMIQYNKTKIRLVTYIWYLNTVEEGGETEFITGEKIKPEQGKLLLFPATWTYAHRGNTPISNTKYICTGWVYSDVVSF